MSTVTRFAVKNLMHNKYYSSNSSYYLTENLWEASFYIKAPAILDGEKVVMVNITYEEQPYDVLG